MIRQPPVFRLLCSFPAIFLSAGCSWDSMQRTGYETVESMRLNQCLDRPDADCPTDRTRYEDYQSERDQLQDQDR